LYIKHGELSKFSFSFPKKPNIDIYQMAKRTKERVRITQQSKLNEKEQSLNEAELVITTKLK
jgi:hypothetical protein